MFSCGQMQAGMGAESSVYFVSNAHILDALVGTAPRERRFFMEGLHWVRHGKRRPMLLDHPMGPANGKLHPMWSPKGNFKGVRVGPSPRYTFQTSPLWCYSPRTFRRKPWLSVVRG